MHGALLHRCNVPRAKNNAQQLNATIIIRWTVLKAKYPLFEQGLGLRPYPKSDFELRNDDDNVINRAGRSNKGLGGLCTS